MNIALVDDREADRLRLERALREYDKINQLGMRFYHYDSGDAFLEALQPFQYAVIFLDIYMDGMSGVEAARRLREEDDDAILIFLTTSEVHRSDAFSVFASAYLSKPCADDQVFRTLDHVFRIKTEKEKRFAFSFDRTEYSLRYGDIVSLETDGNYLSIVDRSGHSYRTRMTFSAAQSQLDSRFLTLIKGITVNMDHISQITGSSCLMRGGAVFPLHVKHQKDLKQKWLNYKFAKIRGETHAATEGGD